MTENENGECLDTILADMRKHGFDHTETDWGEIRMIDDNEKQTIYIVKIDWVKLGPDLETA